MNEPKFNPEFSFLEKADINQLQNLIDDAVVSDFSDSSPLEILRRKWEVVYVSSDRALLIDLIRLLRYNMRILDKGGLSAGRSKIYNFLSEQNDRLMKEQLSIWNEVTDSEVE